MKHSLDPTDLRRAVRAALGCAQALHPDRELDAKGSRDELGGRGALFLLSLNLAEKQGWLEPGTCARWAALGAGEIDRELKSSDAFAQLREQSGGALPLGDARDIFSAPIADPALESIATLLNLSAPIDALSIAYEALAASSRGRAHRREQGVYYTPPEVAAQVVALAFAHAAELPARPRVFDCCAGAGVFLLAAARAQAARGVPIDEAVLLCAGSDLDARALDVTRASLALRAGPRAKSSALAALQLTPLDSLLQAPPGPPIDLLITNPPYGHALDARARAALSRRYPALRGAEIDLYAAFILRALALVRPGGTAALLVPDTWMTNARSSKLRAAVLDQAELRAVADLGKPFAAAKDTRVQAIVLTRRDGLHANHLPRPTFTARLRDQHDNQVVNVPDASGTPPSLASRPALDSPPALDSMRALEALSPLDEAELRAKVAKGWQPYRSTGERALVAAMDLVSIPFEQICAVGYGLRTGNNARHVARGEILHEAIGLVGGEEIEPFRLNRKPKWLREPTPELLRLAKKQQGVARIAVQRIRTNAASPWARWLEAAPIPPRLVCLDSLSTLAPLPGSPPELLWALLGLLGSVALNRYHRLQTTDVNVKPSALRMLPAPKRLADAVNFTKIVNLSKARAEVLDPLEAHRLERAIDRTVYDLYALEDSLIDEAERGFWGERFDAERALLHEQSASRPAVQQA